MNLRFYKCSVCGKVITILDDTGVPTVCCGRPMNALVPNGEEGDPGRHIPVFRREGDTLRVRVGSEPHPMREDHSIVWLCLAAEKGFRFALLRPGDAPEAVFPVLPGEDRTCVYAYCDRHGLWSTEADG